MEHQLLTDIASRLFANIPLALWHDKRGAQIELHVQQLVSQLANILWLMFKICAEPPSRQ